MMTDLKPYDASDASSIEAYAQRLVGHTLREMTDVTFIEDPKIRRGAFGNAIEQYYFGYKPNSDPRPDFVEAGLELKVTPLKRGKKGELKAKERLVISMIDYMGVPSETFDTSHLMQKMSRVLLIGYVWEPDVDPLDYKIALAQIWRIPKSDLPQIRADWKAIHDKVCSGHAEDISGSDTLYLEACTKAADSSVRRPQPFSPVPAKPRAWALKSSYMTAVENQLIEQFQSIVRTEEEEGLPLIDLVRMRFEAHFGSTQAELANGFGISKSKNQAARITGAILGVEEEFQIEEFVKAGAKTKTIRLKRNGKPKEAISFPAIDYYELEYTPFEYSDFYEQLHQLYLFVIYREDEEGDYRLSDVCFWQMPDSDLDEAKRCYEQMQENVKRGRADISVRSVENRCCHVRPHGRDASDTRPQPHGEPVTKKSFWLNQSYVASEIARVLAKKV